MNSAQDLEDLINHYKLLNATPDIFFGEYRNVAFSLTILGVQPISILLKFKANNKSHPKITFPDKFKSLKSTRKADIDFHAGYVWISFYDLSTLNKEEVISLVEEIFNELLEVRHFSDEETCYVCHQLKDSSSVKYLDGEICRICSDCLDEKIMQKEEHEKKANKGNSNFILVLIPIFFISVSVWVLFWLGCDKAFNSTGSKRVAIPIILIAFVMGITSLIISYPLGTLLRKSGIFNVFPRIPVIILILVVTILLGESIYLKITLKGLTLDQIMSNLTEIIKLYDKDLLFHKGLLVILTGYGLNTFSRKVEKKRK